MNEIIRTIQELRTTRKSEFNSEKIDDMKIDIIKQTMTQTSNASNRQSYSVIVLDRNNAKELGLPGDKVFIFCIDFLRLRKCAEVIGCEFDSQYFMQYTTSLIDVSLMVQSAVISAQSLGIETLITNEIYHNKLDNAFKQLNLPKEYVFPIIAVSMGYSDVEKEPKGRIDDKFVFFDNQYKNYTEEDIRAIVKETDDKQNKIGLIDKWDTMGFDHYYEWFYEKWSKAIGTKTESEHLEEMLKRSKII